VDMGKGGNKKYQNLWTFFMDDPLLYFSDTVINKTVIFCRK